jgi:hypothetical protein
VSAVDFHSELMAYACRTCDAQPGQSCKTSGDYLSTHPHANRFYNWRKDQGWLAGGIDSTAHDDAIFRSAVDSNGAVMTLTVVRGAELYVGVLRVAGTDGEVQRIGLTETEMVRLRQFLADIDGDDVRGNDDG